MGFIGWFLLESRGGDDWKFGEKSIFFHDCFVSCYVIFREENAKYGFKNINLILNNVLKLIFRGTTTASTTGRKRTDSTTTSTPKNKINHFKFFSF